MSLKSSLLSNCKRLLLINKVNYALSKLKSNAADVAPSMPLLHVYSSEKSVLLFKLQLWWLEKYDRLTYMQNRIWQQTCMINPYVRYKRFSKCFSHLASVLSKL